MLNKTFARQLSPSLFILQKSCSLHKTCCSFFITYCLPQQKSVQLADCFPMTLSLHLCMSLVIILTLSKIREKLCAALKLNFKWTSIQLSLIKFYLPLSLNLGRSNEDKEQLSSNCNQVYWYFKYTDSNYCREVNF